jgi:hypothetical protein
MSYQAQFNRTLDGLYERRTAELRRLLTRKPGALRTITKDRRERKIRELEEIASKALAKKIAKKRFKTLVLKKKTWRTKGWGEAKKKRMFRAWVREKLSPRKSLAKRGKIYIFWRKRECRYVGRTRRRGSRPSRHFERGWFRGTTRIDVYVAHQTRSIPLLECLAIHRFHPTKNKMKAATENWTPKCPLCALQKKIRTELRKIYRFR